MYEEQLVYIDSSYMMFYGGAAVLALVACIYLLFRRSNAIVPGITPPLRLRRWTAAFFAVMFLSHLWWWLIIHYALIGDLWLNFMVAASLACLMVVPTLMAVMVVMLQDRRRSLWPIAAALAPIVVFFVVCIPQRSNTIVSLVHYYFLLLGILFIIYMVCSLRQYSRWLRDNYADLEYKEIRYSVIAFVIALLFNVFYLSGSTGDGCSVCRTSVRLYVCHSVAVARGDAADAGRHSHPDAWTGSRGCCVNDGVADHPSSRHRPPVGGTC